MDLARVAGCKITVKPQYCRCGAGSKIGQREAEHSSWTDPNDPASFVGMIRILISVLVVLSASACVLRFGNETQSTGGGDRALLGDDDSTSGDLGLGDPGFGDVGSGDSSTGDATMGDSAIAASNLTGVLLDSSTFDLAGVAGVGVLLDGVATTQTDASGHFEFLDIEPGNHTIIFEIFVDPNRRIVYAAHSEGVVIITGESLDITVWTRPGCWAEGLVPSKFVDRGVYLTDGLGGFWDRKCAWFDSPSSIIFKANAEVALATPSGASATTVSVTLTTADIDDPATALSLPNAEGFEFGTAINFGAFSGPTQLGVRSEFISGGGIIELAGPFAGAMSSVGVFRYDEELRRWQAFATVPTMALGQTIINIDRTGYWAVGAAITQRGCIVGTVLGDSGIVAGADVAALSRRSLWADDTRTDATGSFCLETPAMSAGLGIEIFATHIEKAVDSAPRPVRWSYRGGSHLPPAIPTGCDMPSSCLDVGALQMAAIETQCIDVGLEEERGFSDPYAYTPAAGSVSLHGGSTPYNVFLGLTALSSDGTHGRGCLRVPRGSGTYGLRYWPFSQDCVTREHALDVLADADIDVDPDACDSATCTPQDFQYYCGNS